MSDNTESIHRRVAAQKMLEKLVGPYTQQFRDYLKKQTRIDMKSIMGPGTHMADHYMVEDSFVLFEPSLRCYFEGRDIEFTENDVFLTSFPKSGTTWLQMIALLALHDCNVEKVKNLNIDMEIPTLELPECTSNVLRKRPSPRYIKTHLPYNMLPLGNCNRSYKIIHITRNPKDLAVSLYHFFNMFEMFEFKGDIKSVVNLFLNDAVIFAPFDTHCLSYWEHRNDENVLFLTYEDLHKEPFKQVKAICNFLGKDFSDEQIDIIARASSFHEMASNPNSHHRQWVDSNICSADKFNFMRKGKVGDWKDHFDEELDKKFNDWIESRFAHTDIVFDYE